MIHNPVVMGTKLPSLTNPARAANIQSGYQAIDGNGNKVVGTAVLAKSYSINIINNCPFQVRIVLGDIQSDYSKNVDFPFEYSACNNKSYIIFGADTNINVEFNYPNAAKFEYEYQTETYLGTYCKRYNIANTTVLEATITPK